MLSTNRSAERLPEECLMGLCKGSCFANPSLILFFKFSLIIDLGPKANNTCQVYEWNILDVPVVALSCVLWDVLKLRRGIQDPLFLTCHKLFVSGLDGSGFAPCLPFHMIECVSVHEYANVGYFLSHTIWKCQFWWWRTLISPRQANENTGQGDFSVICPQELMENVSCNKIWSLNLSTVSWYYRESFGCQSFPSTVLDGNVQWLVSWEMIGRRIKKNDFQAVMTYSRVFVPLQESEKSALTLLLKNGPKAVGLQMTELTHSGVFWSLNMHNLRQQSN